MRFIALMSDVISLMFAICMTVCVVADKSGSIGCICGING
jgi:hypothetical protein